MEYRLIQCIILDPAENFTRNAKSLLISFFKSLIIVTFAIPLLQEIDNVVVYSESILFAGMYFMETHNWKRSILIPNMEFVGYFIYATFYQPLSIMLYIIIMDLLFKSIVNFFLTKCIYFFILWTLQLPRDVIMVLGMVTVIRQYIFRHQHKDRHDLVLGLAMSLCLKAYFDEVKIEYALIVLYIGMSYWIIQKTRERVLWANGNFFADLNSNLT